MDAPATTDMLTEVTDEQWVTIRAELEKLLKTEQKDGEDLPTYARRLARAASDPKKISDDDWETLSEDPTQKWVNGANFADEKGKPVPLPPGSAAAAEETAPKGNGKKTGNGKKKAATTKAPAKKAPAKAPAKAAPPAKKAPAKKAPAAEKARGRPTLFSDTDVIRIKKKDPFRAGTESATGFSKIRDGGTVAEAIAAGTPRRLIRWAKICEYIDVRAPKK